MVDEEKWRKEKEELEKAKLQLEKQSKDELEKLSQRVEENDKKQSHFEEKWKNEKEEKVRMDMFHS